MVHPFPLWCSCDLQEDYRLTVLFRSHTGEYSCANFRIFPLQYFSAVPNGLAFGSLVQSIKISADFCQIAHSLIPYGLYSTQIGTRPHFWRLNGGQDSLTIITRRSWKGHRTVLTFDSKPSGSQLGESASSMGFFEYILSPLRSLLLLFCGHCKATTWLRFKRFSSRCFFEYGKPKVWTASVRTARS